MTFNLSAKVVIIFQKLEGHSKSNGIMEHDLGKTALIQSPLFITVFVSK